MDESEDLIFRIICCQNVEYCATSRGRRVVFALINPFDRYQHWIKDEKHGATIKDSEGQPAFALVNRGTGQAINHGPIDHGPIDKPMLWTMSKQIYEGFWNIRRADRISAQWFAHEISDGHLLYLRTNENSDGNSNYPMFRWQFQKVLPSLCIILFSPSQHTVKIICQVKVGYNLAIDKDGSTVLLVPANPKDKYQHWIIQMAYGVPVRDEQWHQAFSLVNKATGKAIKHGFGHNYLVQVAPFNPNYMDHSLLWAAKNCFDGFQEIRMQTNIDLVFNIFDEGLGNSPLLGLSRTSSGACQRWRIEQFE